MMQDQVEREGDQKQNKTPALEWIAAGIGMIITVGMLGFIGWNAYRGPDGQPPAIAVRIDRVVPTEAGFVVEVTARNRSPHTASAVVIEGELKKGGRRIAASQATFDYVPGHSERRGGLFFKQNPRALQLEVRALGYAAP